MFTDQMNISGCIEFYRLVFPVFWSAWYHREEGGVLKKGKLVVVKQGKSKKSSSKVKRVAAGAHFPTPRLCEPAERERGEECELFKRSDYNVTI